MERMRERDEETERIRTDLMHALYGKAGSRSARPGLVEMQVLGLAPRQLV